MARFCPRCDARFEGDVRACPADGAPTYALGGDNLVGRKVDNRFTITGRLGAGGMGTVYRARQHSIDRDVALKVLRPEFLSDENAVRRFFREARAASRLTNPHIISVFDFGCSTDGLFYIAMEMLRGQALSDVVRSEGGPMDPARAVGLVDQILEALEEAHRGGVLHRDLKSDNVFVLDDPPGFVKVLDFGLAKMIRADDSMVTEAGTTFGTPAFMSPEQACGREVDVRSDLYSAGAILFELLAGRLPFVDESSIALLVRKVQEAAPSVVDVAPTARIPPALDQVVERLLAIDPAGRPATASEVRSLIRAAVGLQDQDGRVFLERPSAFRQRSPAKGASQAAPRETAIDPPTPSQVSTPAVPTLVGPVRDQVLTMLAQGIGLAGEGWKLYDQAVRQCTSRPAQDLFAALLTETGTVAGQLRRAATLAGKGEGRLGEEPVGRDTDPAGRFEESVRTFVAAIQADAQFSRALDAGLAYERRMVDFWDRHFIAGADRPDAPFVQRRLIGARGRVATLAEVKLRVLGLLRGAGFNSLYMRLAGQLPVRPVRAGEILFREGEPGDSMVVVVSGRFRLEVQGQAGRSTRLAEIGPGDVVGEMTCLDPAPRSATVTAIDDAEVCLVERGTLSALRDGDTASYVAVLRAVVAQVAERVRETDARIEALVREIRSQPRGLGDVGKTGGGRRAVQSVGDSSTRACSFNVADMTLLRQVARHRQLQPGAWLCREGEAGNACFVVTSGHFQIVKGTAANEMVLATLSEGSVVGQIVLVDGGQRSASVRALDVAEVLELDRETFARLLDAHVPLALRFQEQLAVTGIRQLRLADRWLASLLQSREGGTTAETSARPQDDDDAARQVVAYMRTALREWGMSLDELDQVRVASPSD